MPLSALALVLVAALLHAGWNLLVKRAKERQVITWWALVVGVICFSPFLLLNPAVPGRVWPFVVCSAVVEGIYYIALTRAYGMSDFSLVYPLARGAAPAFLVLWAVLFLGERPRPAGYIGLTLLVLGLCVVGGKTLLSLRKAAHITSSGIGIALGVAFCISVYSAIDGAAVHIASPLPYTVLVMGLSTLCITPFILLRYGRQTVVSAWRAQWLTIICVGILSLLAYILVLQAYAIAHVSYAGAVREISVVLAALLGWRLLGEEFGLMRTVGATLIFLGILIIAVLG
jgi:drug/metabolite transporter (DMT)-like permease